MAAVSAVFMVLTAFAGTLNELLVYRFFTGFGLCLGSVTASLYPTRARSTGVGWALSIGRAGSITAPLIGAMALSGGARNFFLIAAIAPLIAAAGLVVLSRLTRATSRGER